ncbi:alpha/beta hydrolase [Pseudonocardia abyssalis]|nr:alpha/beta hydrolase [Pseudonocardia abyssalis]
MVDGPRVAGLLLWASYPADDQSGRDVPTLSVSGDRDGLATPDDISATAARLPAGARSVVVTGGVHAFFGDYGEQPGDGVAGVDRASAQRQTVEASRGFVDAIR